MDGDTRDPRAELERLVADAERLAVALPDERLSAAWRQLHEVFQMETDRRRAHALERLRIDMRVAFPSPEGRRLEGTVHRVSGKTVLVCTPDGTHWRLSPHLVTPIAAPGAPARIQFEESS